MIRLVGTCLSPTKEANHYVSHSLYIFHKPKLEAETLDYSFRKMKKRFDSCVYVFLPVEICKLLILSVVSFLQS